MSLFLQYIGECYFYGDYQKIREAMKQFEKGRKPFPECIYRELNYGIQGTFKKIRDEELLPIRFLSLFGLHEQRLRFSVHGF